MNLIIESNELAFILEHKHIFSIIEYLLHVLTQLKEIKFWFTYYYKIYI
jgi:hypothetical protein